MKRDPWASFWLQGGGAGQGCLPAADGRLADPLIRLWAGFARSLKPGAALLDLAAGDGAVLRHMMKAGRRLDLVGVDGAPRLPKAKGFKLLAGVRMEKLPFEAARFDAITSQFGVEYGEVPAIAAEVARVIRPAGRMRLVVHHRAGRIVDHNERRRRALDWARQGSGIMDKARALANARRHVPLATPIFFASAVQDAAVRFPDQPVAAEYLAGIYQALALPPGECQSRLAWIDQNGADEIARIDALLRVACDEPGIEELRSCFAAAGLNVEPAQPVLEEDGAAFAWLIDGGAGGTAP